MINSVFYQLDFSDEDVQDPELESNGLEMQVLGAAKHVHFSEEEETVI